MELTTIKACLMELKNIKEAKEALENQARESIRTALEGLQTQLNQQLTILQEQEVISDITCHKIYNLTNLINKVSVALSEKYIQS